MRKLSWKTLSASLLLFCLLLWIKEYVFAGIVLTGGVSWSLLSMRAKLRELWHKGPRALKQTIYWLAVVLVSIGAVVFIKTYIFDLMRLPSSSMEPNFRSGQIVVINKLSIGPRLSAHHIDKYSRAQSLSSIKRFDIAVFNFPISDSLPSHATTIDSADNQLINKLFYSFISTRPRYIKRIVALPGDTFEIRLGQALTNGQPLHGKFNQIARYKTVGSYADSLLNSKQINIYHSYEYKKDTLMELSTLAIDSLRPGCVVPFSLEKNMPDPNIFPHTFFWNSDNIGPLVIPKKDATVSLTIKNIDLYKRIIEDYESNDLQIKKTDIYINGKKTDEYTFKLNYYWVMGDNQPHSFDSRYWGFLPENHIIGVTRSHFNIGF